MDAAQWPRVREVYHGALNRDADSRAAYLDEACTGDEGLRQEVEALLGYGERAADFLEPPSSAPLSELLGSAPPDRLVGKRFGSYTIRDVLGRGGMGVVYAAEQDSPHRTVALKVLRPGIASRQMFRRFEHEAQLLGRLQHPGIAQIFEASTAAAGNEAVPFFAMELIQGQPITEYANRRGLGTRERLGLLAQVCEAVEHAHQKGVIHRDLKPGNVFVDESGAPKVLDFGVARATDSDVQTTTLQTDIGQLIGTVPYMSPEQVLGDPALLDTRSDVYSLGVLSYELLAGRLPYELRGKTIPEAVRVIREEEPTTLSTAQRRFRGDLETIVGKALAKDKEQRYQSASELGADLRRYLRQEPILARPPSAAYQLRKLIARHRVASASIAVFFALIMGFGVWMSVLYHRSDRLRAVAERESAESQQVQAFLQDVISGARPESGRDLTMKEALDMAAERVEAKLGDHPEVEAAVRVAIGTAYRSLARSEIAERHLRRALELRQQLWGTEHRSTAESMRLLGITLRSQDKYHEALELFQQALAIKERLLGEEHLNVALTLNSMALALKRLGRFAEAEECLRRAVAIDRQHPQREETLAIHLTNLGSVVRDDPEAQERMLLEALDILRRLNKPTALASTLSFLMGVAEKQGRLDEAEDCAREQLRTVRSAYPHDHPRVANSLLGLGRVLVSAERLDEAEPLVNEALSIYREHWGDDHRRVARALTCLARLEEGRGDGEAATAHVREAAQILRRIPARNHPDIDSSMMGTLGEVLMRLGRPAEAQSILRECLERCRLRSPPDARPIARAAALLGEALTALGRYEEAETVLLESHSTITAADDAGTRAALEAAVQRLIDLYETWGRPEQAAEWRATR